jgi:hypothetical protein
MRNLFLLTNPPVLRTSPFIKGEYVKSPFLDKGRVGDGFEVILSVSEESTPANNPSVLLRSPAPLTGSKMLF